MEKPVAGLLEKMDSRDMSWSGDTGRLDRRASDADRDRVATSLREHLAQGRLSLSELEDRLELVYVARTFAELEAITTDLPEDEPRPSRPPSQPKQKRDWVTSDFRIHAGIWLVFVLFWVLIWALSGFGNFWPAWPATAWGVAVGIHGVVSYNAAVEREARRTRRQQEPAGSRPPRRGPQTRVTVMAIDLPSSPAPGEPLHEESTSYPKWPSAGTPPWTPAAGFSQHQRTALRRMFLERGGRQVASRRDGFLVRFERPFDAVLCAADIQRRLTLTRESGEPVPKVRIGIHAGDTDGKEVLDPVVDVASAVSAEAEPDEIMVTEAVADEVEGRVKLTDQGVRPLTGMARPRHLLSVDWTGEG